MPLTADPEQSVKAFSEDYIGSLRRIMQSYIKEGNMNIHLLAELSNDSVRSLQRKLTGGGTSYSDILEKVLYKQACNKLHLPDRSVQLQLLPARRDTFNLTIVCIIKFRTLLQVPGLKYRADFASCYCLLCVELSVARGTPDEHHRHHS